MVKTKLTAAPLWTPGSRYLPEFDGFVPREFIEEARWRVARAHRDNRWAEGLFAAVKTMPEGPFMQGPATDVEALKYRVTAAAHRRMVDGLLSGRQGVIYTRGTCQDLRVNATGVADGFVHVVAGVCYVRGTQAGDQGMYHLYNDATLDINVLGANPAHATLDRIDLVVARMQDSFYSGSNDVPTIEMVTGTPAGSPTVPTAPANSLILAQISVVHATATIPQAAITDRRVPAGNGIIVLDDILVGTDSRYLAATPQITFLNTSNVGTNLLPPGLSALIVEWYARGDNAVVSIGLNARFNNDAGGNYDMENLEGSAATAAAAEFFAQSSAQAADIPAASANANWFGSGSMRINNPYGTVGTKPGTSEYMYFISAATGNLKRRVRGFHWRTVGAPITRLDLLTAAGNAIVGSRFVLSGVIGIQP